MKRAATKQVSKRYQDEPDLGAALDDFLSALETRMWREVSAVPAALPAAPLLAATGKRLRARLLWLSAAAVRPPANQSEVLSAAAAIELAHLASLVHDDIVDHAETRRGVTAVHRRHGIAIAVNCGTALLHIASALGAALLARARRAVSGAAIAASRGQMRELARPFHFLSAQERLAVTREKTAAFFELAAEVAAVLIDARRTDERALRRFARRFGVAFQIADDILDLVGDPVRLGRPNGADLRQGVITLPVILAADSEPTLERLLQRVRTHGSAEDVAACIRAIRNSGGIEAAANESRVWMSRAVAALSSLRPSPARALLRSLAETAVAMPPSTNSSVTIGTANVNRCTPPRCKTSLAGSAAAAGVVPAPGPRAAIRSAVDALVLEHACRIDPTLVPVVDGALQERATTDLTRKLSCRLTSPATDLGTLAATRAFAIAQTLASGQRLTRDPVRAITTADCLHAVALSFVSTSCVHAHARLESLILNELSDRSPRLSQPVCSPPYGATRQPLPNFGRQHEAGSGLGVTLA